MASAVDRSKWQDGAARRSHQEALEAAAEAAARVNAMLIAKGKLKPSQLSQPQVKAKSQQSGSNLIVAEVEINDVPIGCRNMLTRGTTQEEISKQSGAAVSTRGRFIPPQERQRLQPGSSDRPLYLCVQGPTQESVDLAVNRIREIISHGLKPRASNNNLRFGPPPGMRGPPPGPRPQMNQLRGQANRPPLLNPPPPLMSLNPQPPTVTLITEKLFIGLEHAPPSFDVKGKLLGPGGSFLQHIQAESGCKVSLRGKGSGFLEPSTGREAFEPMLIQIQHSTLQGVQAGKGLTENLIQTVQQDYAQFQSALAALPPPAAMPGGATLLPGLPPHQTPGPHGGTMTLLGPHGSLSAVAQQQPQQPGLPDPSGPPGMQTLLGASIPVSSAMGQPPGSVMTSVSPFLVNTSIPPPGMVSQPAPNVTTTMVGSYAAAPSSTALTFSGPPPQLIQQPTLGLVHHQLQPGQVPQGQMPPGQVHAGGMVQGQVVGGAVNPHALGLVASGGQPGVMAAQQQPQQMAPPQAMMQAPGGLAMPAAPQQTMVTLTQVQHMPPSSMSAPPPMLTMVSMAQPMQQPPPQQAGLPLPPQGMMQMHHAGTPMPQPAPGQHQHMAMQHSPQPGGFPPGMQPPTMAPQPAPPQQPQQPQPQPQPQPPTGEQYYQQFLHQTSISMASAVPTSSITSATAARDPEHSRPQKRRFTEEKQEEKLPDNLFGYEHGPPHLSNLSLQRPGQMDGGAGQPPAEGVPQPQAVLLQQGQPQPQMCNSPNPMAGQGSPDDRGRSEMERSLMPPPPPPLAGESNGNKLEDRDKQMMPPPPPPGKAGRSPGEPERKRAKSTALGGVTEYESDEDEDEVASSLRKQQQEAAKYSYNQYQSKPQIYQQPADQGGPPPVAPPPGVAPPQQHPQPMQFDMQPRHQGPPPPMFEQGVPPPPHTQQQPLERYETPAPVPARPQFDPRMQFSGAAPQYAPPPESYMEPPRSQPPHGHPFNPSPQPMAMNPPQQYSQLPPPPPPQPQSPSPQHYEPQNAAMPPQQLSAPPSSMAAHPPPPPPPGHSQSQPQIPQQQAQYITQGVPPPPPPPPPYTQQVYQANGYSQQQYLAPPSSMAPPPGNPYPQPPPPPNGVPYWAQQ